MLRLIYSTLLYLAAPVVLATTAARGMRDPAYRDRLQERLGFVQTKFEDQPIWIHAVSVGEVQASAALVRALLREYPQRPLLMTTATPTGAQRVQALFGGAVRHCYLPYDLPGSVRRFLTRTRPCMAIVMEREIWPNLFRACGRQRIPIVLASARLSPNSLWRSGWASALVRSAFAKHVYVGAQTADDALRFRSIGADASRTSVTGNLKFDIQIPEAIERDGKALRAAQFSGRPVWIAGSTHDGEESAVLDAHDIVRVRHSGALLILVPRHPNRFGDVADLLTARGYIFARRSRQDAITPETSVLLVDTLGELLLFYAAADVAFVAGSLAPVGGHNLLEPAALALPIVVGPHNFNTPDIAALMLSRGAAMQVTNAAALAEVVLALLADGSRRMQMGVRARRLVEENRGAVDRLMRMVAEVVNVVE